MRLRRGYGTLRARNSDTFTTIDNMGEKKRRLAAPAVNAGAAPAGGRAAQLFESGQQAHRRGMLVEAVNAYLAALKLAPELVEARHFQGLAMLQLGQADLGLSLLRLSCAQAPDNASFHFNLGHALRASDPDGALSALGRAAALAPGDHDFAIAHSELLLQRERVQAAIAELERARALRPQRWENLQGLAELYYRNNQAALARERFAQALALHPAVAQRCRVGFAAPRAASAQQDSTLPAATLLDGAADAAALREFVAAIDLHIIDDFLADPAAYRRQALALPFHQQRYAGQNYPGMQTDGGDCQDIMERIASAVGQPIKFISPDNGSYRLSYADAEARTDIHVDNESGENFNFYAGVLYLNRPEQCQGGTTFWRHGASGWRRRPPEAEVRAGGYPSFKHFQKRWLANVAVRKFNDLRERREDWQALLEVPMRNNRLIIYRGHYFHSISHVFGASPEDGRLVQLFFFELIDAAPGAL
ncbi:tetratricopeptide (TPR) repeat protein [Oxalobacteraceae bacterium GrIS 1.11]